MQKIKICRWYYAIEGLNGVGKTSILPFLENKGVSVFRDPDVDFKIRPLIEHGKIIDDFKKALLYAAGSRFSQRKNISDNIVVSDRSLLSTYALYNSLDWDILNSIHVGLLYPKTVFLLNLEENEIESRLLKRDKHTNEVIDQVNENKYLFQGYKNLKSYFKKINFIDININGFSSSDVADIIVKELKNE